MKKLFTLIVSVLMGSSAMGQELVINGDERRRTCY